MFKKVKVIFSCNIFTKEVFSKGKNYNSYISNWSRLTNNKHWCTKAIVYK